MDEEVAVKAPVTRLRRRLSTEAEGAQSPSTPSTPNKKRGTKLAKPVLELIDENVTENESNKVSSKDVEALDSRPATPARRNTRTRSNTSLLMEATQKIAAESPRAIRALRRNSQIGSDTESTTPARRTRSRKNSTSSIETLALPSNEKVIAQVAEAISEEPEKENSQESKHTVSQKTTPLRKSPRLNKGKNTPNKEQKDDKNNPEQDDNTPSNLSKLTEDNSSSMNKEASINEANSNTVDKVKNNSKDFEKKTLSPSSAKLINEVGANPKKSTDINKSVSSIEESKDDKSTRKINKSWTTMTVEPSNENKKGNKSASGDNNLEKMDVNSPNKSAMKSSNKENIDLKSAQALNASDTVKFFANTPVKDIHSIVYMEDSDSNSGKLVMDEQNDGEVKGEAEDQCVPVVKQAIPKRLTSESFVVEPMDIDETIPGNVTLNDFSDKSNSSKDEIEGTNSKQTSKLNVSGINKSSNKSTRVSINLQEELNNSKRKSSIRDSEAQSDSSEKSQRKSSISILYENENFANNSKRKSSLSKVDDNDKRKSSTSSLNEDKMNESSNKSKRKSLSETETQNQDKVSNASKSTLILSQLKDMSANETNDASKSPNDTNNELSKSVNNPTKDIEKKNQSNTYLTSTPLHQKPLQKLAMQINTSMISPNLESKNTSKANKSKTPVKRVSNIGQDSDSSEDEDSKERNSMVDDEAEEASDGYKSGDSRNAEEKQYEEDHEVTERGETLESEPDMSDDSDYEKDSFVVSSNEEDNDLLSGSDDDLSLSDNELKMTAKSKKKFDERKRKEQKNASREMYAARHQLNESDKSSKSKSKSKKLESSSESETEESQPKKKNRMRIDSSREISANDTNDSIRAKKKKVKRMSESVCEDNANENEITIQNQSVAEKNDPLAGVIKQEPKTPVKDFNMSTVAINENIEQVVVDTNASVLKSNETSDPLQATLAQDDDESDSDISENMEIKENYDSVLENLNKSNNKNKVKASDTSLNLNEKAKHGIKEPIIDELNLTQTKSKKNKTQKAKDTTEKSQTDKQDDNDISDSIDMKLLFSEDSNDSEANKEQISLKRTEAKTNLLENIDESEDAQLGFFIDTKGAYDTDSSTQGSSKKKNKQNINEAPAEAQLNISLNTSKKKKKDKSFSEVSMITDDIVPEETAVDVSMNSEKKKKKNKNKSQLEVSEDAAPEETPINVSMNSEKKKKKNKSLLDVSQINEDAASDEIVSSDSAKKKKNKNKSQLDISHVAEDSAPQETAVDVSVSSAKKKKKNKSLLDASQVVEETVPEETAVNVSMHSEKKKKKNRSLLDVSHVVEEAAPEETAVNISVHSEKKKKKNKSLLDVSHVVEDAAPEEPQDILSTSSSKKKMKNKSQLYLQLLDIASRNKELAALPGIHIDLPTYSENDVNSSPIAKMFEDADNEEPMTHSPKKKKKKMLDASAVEESGAIEDTNGSEDIKKKKKKAKQTDYFQVIDNAGEESDDAPEEIAFKSLKKSDNPEPEEDDDALTKTKNKFKKKKKKSKKVQPELDENQEVDEVKPKKRKHDQSSPSDFANDVFDLTSTKKKKHFEYDDSGNPIQGSKKSKKRKATDEEIHRDPKVFKANSFENVNVSRLPDSIVSQLDDLPNVDPTKNKKDKKKKGYAISTMPFEVDEGPRRKNKPSNYLEQSVYLNDSVSPVKPKKIMKNPKVLPFTPTVITSEKGFTSNFKINVLPQETQFVAQASNIPNFRDKYLSAQRKKKMKVANFKTQRDRLTKF